MTEVEFFRMLEEDEFLNYLRLIRCEFRKDLRFDTECGHLFSYSTAYHNGQYDTAAAIMDKYIYSLEEKYKIGRGINGNN